jgi:S-formylglutathione hydrolase
MTSSLRLASEHRCFGGTVAYSRHDSDVCGGEMRFAVYLPPQARAGEVPVLYFLSGLTCTEETFLIKAGAQRLAAELGLMLVVPDTSPRDTGIPNENADWEVGTAAGFYVDATQAPWASRFRMFSYVTRELPELVGKNFPARMDREGILGHSMGGHGALVCALRQPGRYRSVSAFAPICAPMRCPWGQKAFRAYFGPDTEAWRAWDSIELVRAARSPLPPLLVDQGTRDKFLVEQLKPELLQASCEQSGQPLTLRLQDGYDHGYYFVSTFLADHLRHHATALTT